MTKRLLPPKQELEEYLLNSGRAYLQWVKPRYLRKVKNADKVSISSLIRSMPVIYQEALDTSKLKLVVVKKDYPWTHQDVAIFALGPTEPKMLFNLSSKEGVSFIKLNQKTIKIALKTPGCLEAYCAIGFNPNDDAVGCHTVKRLHSHVCILDKDYLLSRKSFDKKNAANWYFLLTFHEPFSQLFYDLIRLYRQSKEAKEIGLACQSKDIVHHKFDKISIRLRANDFGSLKMFLFVSGLLKKLASEYAKLEAVFTNCKVDPITKRYIPRPREERLKRLAVYCRKTDLSPTSCQLLQYLATHLMKASARKPDGEMNHLSQMWISKGFSGGCIFRFRNNSQYLDFDFYPKVLATQALTRGNGLDSGASTIKVLSTIEKNPHLIRKMKIFTESVRRELQKGGLSFYST